ncbi:MAG TPA: TlpA disulfide reductase family protein [Phnomibacter sp.]|nr:TlpA disulfide reductase family protein [Phnomibacter sp.]
MRNLLLVLTLFVAWQAQAQKKEYANLQVQPQPLKQGQKITLNYTPPKTNLKPDGSTVYAIMLAYKEGKPVGTDMAMKPTKKGQQASFTIPDSADAIAFKFMQQEVEDANQGNGYFYTVTDSKGSPLNGTNKSLAILYGGDYYAGIENPKPELAKKYNAAWKATTSTKPSLLDQLMELYTKKDTAALCNLLKDYEQYQTNSENDYSTYSFFAEKWCNNPALVAAIKTSKEKKYPNGNWTLMPWTAKLQQAKTPAEKLVWAQAFQLAHPEDSSKATPLALGLYSMVASSTTRTADITTFKKAIEPISKNENMSLQLASLLNSAAWQAALKDTLLDEATSLSGQSLRILENMKASGKQRPPTQSEQMYNKDINSSYASFADTYAFLQYKLGKHDSASYYGGIAAKQRKWKDAEINENYFKPAEHVKPAATIISELENAFEQGGYTEQMQAQYVRLVDKNGGNGKVSLEKALAKAKDKKYQDLKVKMINEKAPDFMLAKLDGSKVSLQSLKGKVVVMDFWATWCGPCIASFPGMQKVVDAHKTDKNVAVYFVNTWQSEQDKVKEVKSFFASNPYTFDVLMDSESKVVADYGVSGIPTKFIVDKQGNIRFKSVGYNGSAAKTAEEMEIMIELANSAN